MEQVLSESNLVISIDAMGGDNSPKVVIEGLALAHKRNPDIRFLVYGDEPKVCLLYTSHRFQKVNDCRDIDISAIREKPRWLPKTCAYVLLDEGKPLPAWHPLITGRAASVHEAGVSLQGRKLINESEVTDYENYIVEWKDL